MWRALAPMERRIPISRVRSITFMVMVFTRPIMPMAMTGMPRIISSARIVRFDDSVASRST